MSDPQSFGGGESHRTRRLLFVVNNPEFFLTHRGELAKRAVKLGWHVGVACPEGPMISEIVELGIEFCPWNASRAGKSPVREFLSLLSLAGIYRRFRPTLVHLVTIKAILYGGVLARLLRTPAMVAAVAGMGYLFVDTRRSDIYVRWLVEKIYRVALRHANSRVIFQNDDDRRLLSAIGAVSDAQAVMVPGSGVDLAKFKPTPSKSDADPPIAILPARMLWHKGVGEFVQASKILREAGLRVRMVLVGGVDSGNPAGVPERQLREWHDSQLIEWWGHRSDMPRVVENATLVVLPSYREGMPKSLLEAAAAGLPIVTTDTPGCRDVVVHGWNGLVVPPKDPTALARAIQNLVTDRGLASTMGSRSRRRAEKYFGVESVVLAQIQIYEELYESIPPR